MSIERKIENDLEQSACRLRNVEESVGSHYALKVALQTMKERCQRLQQRLGVVEEENHSLRIENRKRKSDSSCAIGADELNNGPGDLEHRIDCLEEKVATLTRQKSQLTHHLFMVATENRQLWNRLSHLTQANENLGSHLSKISSTLSRHHSASSITVPKSLSPTSSLLHSSELNVSSDTVLTKENSNVATKATDTVCEGVKKHNSSPAKSSGDVAEESLEEISLKLIKSFLQEKTELEEQYAQMVEIQSDPSLYSIQNLGFGYPESGNKTIDDMKEHHKKLMEVRDMLKEQQTVIKAAIANIERVKKGGALCSHCQKKSQAKLTSVIIDTDIERLQKWGVPDGTSYSEGIQRQLNQVAEPPTSIYSTDTSTLYKESICPLCGRLYSKGSSFIIFQQHVTDHFTEEEESDSILNNFELIA